MIPFDVEPSTGNALLDRILRRLRETLFSLRNAVVNDRLVTVTFPAANTDVQVFHGLDAPVRTWEVVDRDCDVQVWRSSTVNTRPRDTIILRVSGAPCSVLVRFM